PRTSAVLSPRPRRLLPMLLRGLPSGPSSWTTFPIWAAIMTRRAGQPADSTATCAYRACFSQDGDGEAQRGGHGHAVGRGDRGAARHRAGSAGRPRPRLQDADRPGRRLGAQLDLWLEALYRSPKALPQRRQERRVRVRCEQQPGSLFPQGRAAPDPRLELEALYDLDRPGAVRAAEPPAHHRLVD